MRIVYVVSYFYPEGTYAGIIGVYDDEGKAKLTIMTMKQTDYPDCTFVVTRAEVE